MFNVLESFGTCLELSVVRCRFEATQINQRVHDPIELCALYPQPNRSATFPPSYGTVLTICLSKTIVDKETNLSACLASPSTPTSKPRLLISSKTCRTRSASHEQSFANCTAKAGTSLICASYSTGTSARMSSSVSEGIEASDAGREWKDGSALLVHDNHLVSQAHALPSSQRQTYSLSCRAAMNVNSPLTI
jgi:hypothetical protein